jgi:hypothetical protein
LTHLARIDLHTNRITTLPEYAYSTRNASTCTTIRVGSTLARLHGEIAQQWDDHVTAAEARTLWLRDVPPSERAQRGELWDDVLADPESNAFFTVLADTTRSAEYASQATRSGLAARLWDMLEATRESQEIRETLLAPLMTASPVAVGGTVRFARTSKGH